MWQWIKGNKWHVVGLLAVGFFFGGFIFGIPLLLIRTAKNALLGSGTASTATASGIAETAAK